MLNGTRETTNDKRQTANKKAVPRFNPGHGLLFLRFTVHGSSRHCGTVSRD
jgi:hypothetical protein